MTENYNFLTISVCVCVCVMLVYHSFIISYLIIHISYLFVLIFTKDKKFKNKSMQCSRKKIKHSKNTAKSIVMPTKSHTINLLITATIQAPVNIYIFKCRFWLVLHTIALYIIYNGLQWLHTFMNERF